MGGECLEEREVEGVEGVEGRGRSLEAIRGYSTK